jgi:CheY-like chemotaxis protein
LSRFAKWRRWESKSFSDRGEHALDHKGFGVESFSDGEKAIDRLYASPEPCLILLDMMMPIMSGEEFMEHFHKLPATILPIPVFLVSATSNEAHSMQMGCRGFMKSPLTLMLS